MRGRSRHRQVRAEMALRHQEDQDRKSTRLNSSHGYISYAVFCLKKKKKHTTADKLTPISTVSSTMDLGHTRVCVAAASTPCPRSSLPRSAARHSSRLSSSTLAV